MERVRSEKFEFPNDNGDKLAGRLEWPVAEPRAFAVFAHCFTCSKDVAAASRISRALTDKGVAVLRFDFTGLGNSEGDFSNTNFSTNVQDLVCAAEHLQRVHKAPELLIGHSLGGAAVISAAEQISSCKAVVTIGAPSDISHVAHLFKDFLDEINEKGEADVTLAGRDFKIKKQFVKDINKVVLENKVENLDRALAIFHSPQDEIVSIEHARELFIHAKHPKSFISLDGADHLLSNKKDSQYVAGVIAAWADKYLSGTVESEREQLQKLLQRENVLVSARRGERFTQDIYTADHAMVADEPEKLNGSNLGPSPYEFLMAALGSCTSMTIKMYAERKGLPLKHVAVKLKHEKVHAKDCVDCEDKAKKIDQVTVDIAFDGDLTSEQENKLMEIAEKCPVYRTLNSNIDFKHTLVE